MMGWRREGKTRGSWRKLRTSTVHIEAWRVQDRIKMKEKRKRETTSVKNIGERRGNVLE